MKTEKRKRTKIITTVALVSILLAVCLTAAPAMAQVVREYDALVPWDAKRISGGNTLITEYGNHTIIEVTPGGAIVWQYGTGTQGSGPDELDCPVDAERLSSGYTLITDYNNHRVIEVSHSGTIVWQYGTGTAGNGTNQLHHPTDAERLSDGNTLIADRINNRVITVKTSDYNPSEPNNGFTAGSIVWEMTGLYHPFDADRLSDGNTLIADYRNHRVIEVTPAKNIVWQYGTGRPEEYGSGVNELNNPIDAERLSNGNTMIADNLNDRVIDVRTSDYDPAKDNNGFTVCSILWSYDANHTTDAECLSTGNTLICEAASNRVIEIVTPAEELKPSTSFFISGWVNYDIGGAINNPNVTITNLNTTEVFTAQKNEGSHYYQVLTGSCNVNAGNVLRLLARDNGNKSELVDHTVNETEMNRGGFVHDIEIVYPVVPEPDLTVSEIDAYHHSTYASPWFNLSNEVDVTVSNIGSLDAGTFNVSLYADGVSIDTKTVSDLGAGNSTTVQFNWTPVGENCFKDCVFTDTSKDYNLMAVADCDGDVDENDETNNDLTRVEKACYNGYMADEPLENVAQGMLHGGLLFTTGDGSYGGLYSHGSSRDTTYEITLPANATVKLARLNVYYTWHYERWSCPDMRVTIRNHQTGVSDVVPLKESYNDMKCQRPGASWVFPWGNHVFDLTDYVQGSGTYTVTVTNAGSIKVSIAAPGIVLVYEDKNAPMIEYWINEGADVLIGGRRTDGGYLSLEECITNATFPGSIYLAKVENATLGVVSPWGEKAKNVLYFNEIELGRGVYLGNGETVDKTIDSINMHIGSTNAQVGVNVSDVTDQLRDSGNVVGQGDDGDNMMPSNAFLVVEYMPPICGDVNCDRSVDVSDVIRLAGHVRYPADAEFAVDVWAADVNCDDSIDIGDVILLLNHVRNSTQYPLNCCV